LGVAAVICDVKSEAARGIAAGSPGATGCIRSGVGRSAVAAIAAVSAGIVAANRTRDDIAAGRRGLVGVGRAPALDPVTLDRGGRAATGTSTASCTATICAVASLGISTRCVAACCVATDRGCANGLT
jgi:hypothetical protein